jgi:hypothetical protein
MLFGRILISRSLVLASLRSTVRRYRELFLLPFCIFYYFFWFAIYVLFGLRFFDGLVKNLMNNNGMAIAIIP